MELFAFQHDASVRPPHRASYVSLSVHGLIRSDGRDSSAAKKTPRQECSGEEALDAYGYVLERTRK